MPLKNRTVARPKQQQQKTIYKNVGHHLSMFRYNNNNK